LTANPRKPAGADNKAGLQGAVCESSNANGARRPRSRPASAEAVYREHVGFVWRALRRLGVPEAQLEDATQDVFVVVHRRLHEYDGRASITTWLFGIARGIASNRRRGNRRSRDRMQHSPRSPRIARDLERELQEREALRVVGRFLETLPPAQRLLFELAEIEGLRIPEIAEMTGINANTLYTRLRSVRLRFRAHLQACERKDEGDHG
jgi:RNA polymerase sigma-70 factor, ECF subfamily